MKKLLVICAAAISATAFAGSEGPDGTDFVVSADSGETYTYSTAIGNYSRLVKRGAGEVELTVAASGFAGSVIVEAGTLTIKNTSAVGSGTPVTVESGATLWLKLPGSSQFLGHDVTIAGKGVGDNGAFRFTANSGSADYLLDKLILSSDATIKSDSRWGVNERGDGVVLNGHTLTSIGSGKWMVYNKINAGTLVCTAGELTFQSDPVVDQDAIIVITNSASLILFNVRAAAQIKGQAKLCNGNNLSVGYGAVNHLGPVHVAYNQATVRADTGLAMSIDGPLTGDSGKGLRFNGNGEVFLNGPVTLPATMTKNDFGTLYLNGSAQITSLEVAGGSFCMTSAATRTMPMYLKTGEWTKNSGSLTLLSNGTLNCNMFRIADFAAYRQTGGTYQQQGTDQTRIGEAGGFRSFFTMEGGAAYFSNTVHIAQGANTFGAFRQTGGVFNVAKGGGNSMLTYLGENGCALFVQTGGTNDIYWTGSKGSQDNRICMGTNGVATMTVSGTGTVFRTGGFIIGNAGGLSTNILNLSNGGTFKANRFRRNENQLSGSFSCINADGGIMMPTYMAGWNMAYDTDAAFFTRNPDRFVLWEKGLVIDTSENMLNVDGDGFRETNLGFLFEAPTGKGVESVELPSASAYTSSTYIGIVPIVFEDATGWGASAYAEYDFDTKKHTKIVVTSRGCNYSDSAKAYIESPDRSALYECALTLTSNEGKCGPLVKRGTPPLWLHSANTISGGIVVEEGALQTRKANVIPANTPVTVAHGATLDLYNKGDITVSTFTGAGTVTNGSVTVTNAVRATCADLFAGKAAFFANNLTFADGAVFEITDAENLETYKDASRVVALAADGTISRVPSVRFTTSTGAPAVVNGAWSLRLSADGKTFRFGRDKGMVISVR